MSSRIFTPGLRRTYLRFHVARSLHTATPVKRRQRHGSAPAAERLCLPTCRPDRVATPPVGTPSLRSTVAVLLVASVVVTVLVIVFGVFVEPRGREGTPADPTMLVSTCAVRRRPALRGEYRRRAAELPASRDTSRSIRCVVTFAGAPRATSRRSSRATSRRSTAATRSSPRSPLPTRARQWKRGTPTLAGSASSRTPAARLRTRGRCTSPRRVHADLGDAVRAL